MLSSLAIKNIAIIDELEIDFASGLNVMTGETGAGKTIIVQTLSLVLGARASNDIIRTGENEAVVSAAFTLDNTSPSAKTINRILNDSSIPVEDDEIIIRRVINLDGRGKTAINGVPVTLQMLKKVAAHLVDISSQHENQMLLDPSNHVFLIDDFGRHEKLLAEYKESYSKYYSIKNDLSKLVGEAREHKEKLEFMKFQLNELKAANPQKGEIEELEGKYTRLKHAKALESSTREASDLLYDSQGSVVEVLDQIISSISMNAKYDLVLEKWSDVIGRAREDIAEVAREAGEYASKLNEDPLEIEATEDRLHLLKDLVKKYGSNLDDVISKIGSLENEINKVENFEEVLSKLEDELSCARDKLKTSADKLSKARKDSGLKLSREVEEELKSLAMGKVHFVAKIERHEEDTWDANGPDAVEFFISPNVGESLRSLSKTASGGELSRIMLAIKRVLSDRASLASTYIFDEVDSGIGGATADVVGKKLFDVAKARQVICITHLPQVACYGGAHYKINKRIDNGRTVTSVCKVKDSERVEEIARMLGGSTVSDVTRSHALEMLNLTMLGNKR